MTDTFVSYSRERLIGFERPFVLSVKGSIRPRAKLLDEEMKNGDFSPGLNRERLPRGRRGQDARCQCRHSPGR